MSDATLHEGWNSTDEGSDVPVRTSSVKNGGTENSIVIGEHGTNTREQRRGGAMHTVTEINPHMMQLSAITGIGLVILSVAFYMGVLNLRGSVTDTGTVEGVIVTITEQGSFDPASITLQEGESITFVNRNQNPQVLKAEDPTKSLFPVQVVFKDPVTVSIENGTADTYVYVSETLPRDQTLTIHVTPKENPVASPAQSTPREQTTLSDTTTSHDIPLPFGDTALVPGYTEPESVSVMPVTDVPSVTPTFESTSHGKESAVISLGKGEDAEEHVAFTDAPIMINPYTVAEGKKRRNTSADIALTNKKKQSLHSGASLQALREHTPGRTSDTGPKDLWILMVLSCIGLGLTYVRSLRKI